MKYFRYYKEGEFSQWKGEGMSLADKLPYHRQSKIAVAALRQGRLAWYDSEPHGEAYRQALALHFTIHQRQGFQIHELKMPKTDKE